MSILLPFPPIPNPGGLIQVLKEVGIGESRDQWGTVGRVPPIPVKPNTKKI